VDDTPQSVRKLTVPVPTMCDMIGVGLSSGWNLVSKPDLDDPEGDPGKPAIETVNIGRRRLALVSSIEAYIERKRKHYRKVANPPPGEGRRRHRTNREFSPNA